MGESVAEATITKWLKNIGDSVSLDEPIVEIATDKIDTDVTSEVEGIILEQKFNENDIVQIGEVLVVIETDSDIPTKNSSDNDIKVPSEEINNEDKKILLNFIKSSKKASKKTISLKKTTNKTGTILLSLLS